LESFTELSQANTAEQPQESHGEVEALRALQAKCLGLVQKAREESSKGKTGQNQISESEWETLVQQSSVGEDPIYDFLAGAVAWWQLVEGKHSMKEFNLADNGIWTTNLIRMTPLTCV
jgi:hypothetical protein